MRPKEMKGKMEEKNKAIQEALRGLLSTPPRKRADGIGKSLDMYRAFPFH